jgi:serine phosphatase RsbU (regulator of sigma subunit)
MKLLLRCCAALALLVPIPIWAAIELGPDTPLIISDKAGTQVLKETGAPLSPAQALERLAEFGPPPPAATVKADDVYWIVQRVHSTLDRERELRLDLPGWEDVDAYAIAPDGKMHRMHTTGLYWGNYLTLADVNPYVASRKTAQTEFPVFGVRPGEEVIVLTRARANRNFQMTTFTPSFSDHALLLELRRFGMHIEGMQAGFLIALGMFGWFSVFMNRDRTSLAYGVWLIFALLSATSFKVHDGHRFFEFYLPIEGIKLGSEYLANSVLVLFAYCQSIFYVIFARNFLDFKAHMPRVYRITNIYILLTIAHGILVSFIPHTLPMLLVWAPLFTMIMAMLITIFSCAYVRYRQGLQVARFFMIAMVPYMMFRSILFLGLINIPSPFTLMEKSGFGLFMQNSNTAQAFGLCAEAIIMAFAVITRNRWLQEELKQRIEQENHRLEATVTERTRELAESKRELEKQHEIVVDSIRYASRLQKAQLPRLQRLAGYFESFHAIWEPRDTIGGDVWWASMPDERGRITLAVADSTGHGVPGAMLSVLVSTSLEKIYAGNSSLDPASALMALDVSLRVALNQDSDDAESDDGCDAAIVRIDPAAREIEFAGAKLGLLRARADGSIERLPASRLSLGYRDAPHEKPQLHRFYYEQGESFVIVSDGFTDQVGSREGPARAYGYRRLHKLLERVKDQPAAGIAEAMRLDLADWQGAQLRRDDVTAVVFKPV